MDTRKRNSSSANSNSIDLELEDCINCSLSCRFEDNNTNYCASHELTWDGQVIAHFCLVHQSYHCYQHYRGCRKKYGPQVMAAHPQTPFQIKKRSYQIIQEQSTEILKLERIIENMKTARFICAECRCAVCLCDISKWRYYEADGNVSDFDTYGK